MIPQTRHNCLFYNSKKEYLDIVIPYLETGLERNEFCVWVVPETMKVSEAEAALRESVKGLDSYIEKEQILIGDYETLYLKDGMFLAYKMMESLAELEKKALQKGFKGVCATGDCSWALKDENWLNFYLYEQDLNRATEVFSFRAFCSYDISKVDVKKIKQIGIVHQSSLTKQSGEWRDLQPSYFSSLQT